MKKSTYWFKGICFMLFLCGALLIGLNGHAQSIYKRGAVPVMEPIIGFAIDGDAFAMTCPDEGSEPNMRGDWFYNADYPNPLYSLLDQNGEPWPRIVDANMSTFYLDVFRKDGINDPSVFDGSNKIFDHPATYLVKAGTVPPKDDVQRAAAHFTYGNPDGVGKDKLTGVTFPGDEHDLWCIFAADRWKTNGDSYIDFEFNQATITFDEATGTFVSAAGPLDKNDPFYLTHPYTKGRTPGDVLITIEFGNGGGIAEVVVDTWGQDAKGNWTWMRKQLADFPANSIFCTNNLAPTAAPWQVYDNGMNYTKNQFAEGAINLTQILGYNPCYSIATVWCRTKSSDSPSATLKDLAGPPAQLNIESEPPMAICPDDLQFSCMEPDAILTAINTWRTGFMADPEHGVPFIDEGDPDVEGDETEYFLEELTFDPPLASIDEAYVCAGGTITATFTVTDYCEKTDQCIKFITIDYPHDLTIDECPGDPNLDGCSTDVEIEAAWDAWIAGLMAMEGHATCLPGNVVFDPPLEELEMPLQCVTTNQVVSVTATVENMCDDASVTCTFTVQAYTEDLTIDACPGDPNLDGCSDNVQIEAAWDEWIEGLLAIEGHGTCPPGAVTFDPPLDDLEMPAHCADHQQQVSVTATVANHCESASVTCTFTVAAYVDDLTIDACPGDPYLGGCSTDAEIQTAWDEWIAGLLAIEGHGTCPPGEVTFDPPLDDLLMPSQCATAQQVVTVTATVANLCDEESVTCTFTVDPYTTPVTAFCSDGPILETCLSATDIDVFFNAWKEGFYHEGGCEPVTDNMDELMALDWRDFFNENDGGTVYFTYYAYDHCTRDEVTCSFTVPDCPDGCTLTQGYWKTHGDPATSKYDPVWDNIGPSTMFYLSGQTYMEVMWTETADNAYYILASQFIAATLNVYAGASPTPVATELADAAVLFSMYTPAQILGLPGSSLLRQQFIALALQLDLYNRGLLGVVHCDSMEANMYVLVLPSSGETGGLEATDLKVYPNPFSTTVHFEFVSGKTAEARLEIFNVTGQKIATLLERRVEKGVLNRIEYKPVMTPGVLIYRLSLDNEISQGTLIYNK